MKSKKKTRTQLKQMKFKKTIKFTNTATITANVYI